MRYHYEKSKYYSARYGERYICNHCVYDSCTLYKIRQKGLSVIQQRYDKTTKSTFWTDIDAELIDAIYLNPNFKSFFDKRAGKCVNGLYPTVTVRQIMWALRMKPLKKEPWETTFDRKEI